MAAKEPKLDQLRREIRNVDEEILKAIAKRQGLAHQIGQLKFDQGLPIKNYQVEKVLVGKNQATAKQLGLYQEMAEELSRMLIKYSVLTQDDFHKRQRTAHQNSAAQNIGIVGGSGKMGLWLADFFDSFHHKVTLWDETSVATEGQRYPHHTSLAELCKESDVIILATPISATGGILDEITRLGTSGLVFDICSLKTPINDSIQRAVAAGIRMTSLHPMFGPNADVLAGRNIIFCDAGVSEAVDQAIKLFQNTTANIIRIPLAQHDHCMSYVLGLSHLINLLFAQALQRSGIESKVLKAAASTSFEAQLSVVEPILNENQDLYFEIQSFNGAKGDLLSNLSECLADYSKSILNDKRADFKGFMQQSLDYLNQIRGEK